MKRAPGYSRISKTCGLCIEEKLAICEYPNKDILLSSRSEMVSKCRHQNKYILGNVGPDGWEFVIYLLANGNIFIFRQNQTWNVSDDGASQKLRVGQSCIFFESPEFICNRPAHN